MPLKSCDKIMPLFPRASVSAPLDIAAAMSPAPLPSTEAADLTVSRSVRNMLVPVSPSGTGEDVELV